jgi:hypothetical protein
MVRRISALAALIATGFWPYGWEFIRSLFYERCSHLLNLVFENVSLDQLLRWGPPVIFASIGLYLFWKTRPPRTPDAPSPGQKVAATRPSEPQRRRGAVRRQRGND